MYFSLSLKICQGSDVVHSGEIVKLFVILSKAPVSLYQGYFTEFLT
jgi:hypothetical protein